MFIKCKNEWYLEFVFAEFVTDHTCDKQVIAILIFVIVWRARDWCKIKLCIVWLALEITIRLCVVWLVLDIDDDDQMMMSALPEVRWAMTPKRHRPTRQRREYGGLPRAFRTDNLTLTVYPRPHAWNLEGFPYQFSRVVRVLYKITQ